MNKNYKLKTLFFMLSLFSLAVNAQNNITSEYFTLEGTATLDIPEYKNKELNYTTNSFGNYTEYFPEYRKIKFLKIKPTQKLIKKIEEARQQLKFGYGEFINNSITSFEQSPGAVDLGMSNVPVLNQGSEGTCVTFASTASIDALFNIGDAIDQQCSLALNKTLGHDYWHGAYTANQIIDPIKKYGFISKNNCFNSRYPNPNQIIDVQQFTKLSNKTYSNKIISENLRPNLSTLTNALNQKKRVLISFFYTRDAGVNIKNNNGTFTQLPNGFWSCALSGCRPTQYAHEVIVIGYDNNQKLLKIRNS